jgi:hypothetical protein
VCRIRGIGNTNAIFGVSGQEGLRRPGGHKVASEYLTRSRSHPRLGAPEAEPVLARALSDPEPLVRAHAAWALSRVRSVEARAALVPRA